MRTSKRNAGERYQSARTIDSPQLPPTLEQIQQRARDIYLIHGGAEKMTLNDWVMAEKELRRKFGMNSEQSIAT